jgi:carbonic anhydrase
MTLVWLRTGWECDEGEGGTAPHIFLIPHRWDNSQQETKARNKILNEVLAANAKYAENFGDKGNLPLPPSRHFAILTCMDARLDLAKYAGLAERDAHVIRNAGGIRQHPLVPNDIPVYGYIYDVKFGKLVEVPEATMAGRAS